MRREKGPKRRRKTRRVNMASPTLHPVQQRVEGSIAHTREWGERVDVDVDDEVDEDVDVEEKEDAYSQEAGMMRNWTMVM